MNRFYYTRRALALSTAIACLALSGCFGDVVTAQLTPTTTTATSSTSTTTGTTYTAASGPRAVKIILKQASPSGSFDAPSPGGTAAVAGSGLQATRVFNADGSLLASGGVSSGSWPQWLQSFEIGVSGSSNSAASEADCARFAGASESTSTNCNYGGGTGTAACGAGAGLYRVSEYDCSLTPPTTGTGGPNDGVYLRAYFSRANLGSGENLMAVVEYAASSLNAAPANPSSCFTGGVFTPGTCSDMSWQIFLKHGVSEVPQPFMLFVPPTFAYVNTTTETGGSGIAAKQFFLPIASDPTLSVFQLSRITGLANDASLASHPFETACSPGSGQPANSPLCVGMVFYSITFYRM